METHKGNYRRTPVKQSQKKETSNVPKICNTLETLSACHIMPIKIVPKVSNYAPIIFQKVHSHRFLANGHCIEIMYTRSHLGGCSTNLMGTARKKPFHGHAVMVEQQL